MDNGTCLCFGFQWKVSHQGKSSVWPHWGKVYLKMAITLNVKVKSLILAPDL